MTEIDPYLRLASLIADGKNVFLSGRAGTGKSYLIHKINENIDRNILITSTTGVSAYLIGGRTIHSALGVGVLYPNQTVKDVVKKINKNREAKQRIFECDILVIDECSLLGAMYMDMLNESLKIIRKNSKPFGGIQVLISADFFQLPAINDNYAFESNAWTELELHVLTLEKVYRQTDVAYADILTRIRVGQQTREDNQVLLKRLEAYRETDIDAFEIRPTFLTSKRSGVEEMNKEELDKNPEELVVYVAADESVTREAAYCLDMVAPKIVHYKKGCQVMLTINISVENNLVNGSRGVVTELTSDMVFVKFMNGETIPFEKHAFTYQEDDKKVLATRFQFPFILAYCMSIHKSQGMSIDTAVIDLGHSVFGYHSVYVALSRVKTLEGLYLKSYLPQKIQVDPKVVAFYERLAMI